MSGSLPGIVWIKKEWGLDQNPFPAEAIARLGGEDPRENGLLFNPAVHEDKIKEFVDKFVLGAAYSGLRFGYLWSLGTGIHGDARGFGKSSLMQYMVEEINEDFGRGFLLGAGLDDADADEQPLCAMLASFDMANTRSLNAVFYEAARFACRFKRSDDDLTLAQRIHARLAERLGSDDPDDMRQAIDEEQLQLRGRTLGPPLDDFLYELCSGNWGALTRFVDGISAARRSRNGAAYLATFLIMVKAAGVNRVLLCCDQLEDFAATTTTKQKRALETERFRDYILELQPMSDMLSCVVTMHPRATQAIQEEWRLADLPNYDPNRKENERRVIVLRRVTSVEGAIQLLQRYLDRFRRSEVLDPLFPLTRGAIEEILRTSDGKPREILRRAHALIEAGADSNWELVDEDRAIEILGSLQDEFEEEDDAAFPDRTRMWS